jgi:hypothetical protein
MILSALLMLMNKSDTERAGAPPQFYAVEERTPNECQTETLAMIMRNGASLRQVSVRQQFGVSDSIGLPWF